MIDTYKHKIKSDIKIIFDLFQTNKEMNKNNIFMSNEAKKVYKKNLNIINQTQNLDKDTPKQE